MGPGEWGGIAAVIIAVTTAVLTGIRNFTSDARKRDEEEREESERQRRALQRDRRRAIEFGERTRRLLEELILQRYRHNAEQHPNGAGAIQIPELPPDVQAGVRAFLEDEKEEL